MSGNTLVFTCFCYFLLFLRCSFGEENLLFVLQFLMLQQSAVPVSVGILDHESRLSNREVLYSVYSMAHTASVTQH